MVEPVTIATLPAAARLSVRGGADAIAAIGKAYGVALPDQPCRSAAVARRVALWLGPDEWMLIGEGDAPPALAAELQSALDGLPASIVDVSDRSVAIEVSGPAAENVLAAFNPLDLALAAFPVGMCTRTVFAKAEIVLWRSHADVFRIEVWRSFAPYVLGQLAEAAREYLD